MSSSRASLHLIPWSHHLDIEKCATQNVIIRIMFHLEHRENFSLEQRNLESTSFVIQFHALLCCNADLGEILISLFYNCFEWRILNSETKSSRFFVRSGKFARFWFSCLNNWKLFHGQTWSKSERVGIGPDKDIK